MESTVVLLHDLLSYDSFDVDRTESEVVYHFRMVEKSRAITTIMPVIRANSRKVKGASIVQIFVVNAY